MPTPFLPLELVTEIVSHLRASPNFTSEDLVKAGKAISLVCHSWSPVGQALRWNKIACGTYHMSSLTTHFDQYPHLARLVLDMEVPSEMDEIDKATIEALVGGRDLLAQLLGSTTNLRTIDLVDDSGVFKIILPATSRLSSLRSFKAVINRRCPWTSEMISLFTNGFPSLQSFSLSNPLLSLSDSIKSPPTIPSDVQKRKLHALSLEWSIVRNQDTSKLCSYFLSMTDINSLRSCTLMGPPLCSSTLEWLSSAPNLRSLKVTYLSHRIASALPTFLEYLPKLNTLEVITISIDPDLRLSGRDLPSIRSPLPFQSLLSALPPNLLKCNVRQLHFDDFIDLRARRPLPAEGHESYCVVELQKNASWGPSPVLVWQGKGELKCPWRWCAIRASSWKDYDKNGQVRQPLPSSPLSCRSNISFFLQEAKQFGR